MVLADLRNCSPFHFTLITLITYLLSFTLACLALLGLSYPSLPPTAHERYSPGLWVQGPFIGGNNNNDRKLSKRLKGKEISQAIEWIAELEIADLLTPSKG